MDSLGLTPHRSHLRVDLGTPACDWCGGEEKSGTVMHNLPGGPFYGCDECRVKGRLVSPPEGPVARETPAPVMGEPKIPMKERPARTGMPADPLAGLADLGRKPKK